MPIVGLFLSPAKKKARMSLKHLTLAAIVASLHGTAFAQEPDPNMGPTNGTDADMDSAASATNGGEMDNTDGGVYNHTGGDSAIEDMTGDEDTESGTDDHFESTSDHVSDDGSVFCGAGTEWDPNNNWCVATYDGMVQACRMVSSVLTFAALFLRPCINLE